MCDEVFLLACFMCWELGFVTSENIISGILQIEYACTSTHWADSPVGCGSKKQISLCPTVPALRGVYYKCPNP